MEINFIRKDVLQDKSFQLAVRIVRLSRYLREQKNEYVLSKQLIRCGTSPGAMIREARNAESGSDFIHKLSIAQKETSETIYWLELLLATDFLTQQEFDSILSNATEVIKLLTSSIKPVKRT